jgi:lauroyl/myristoyl acyltransferase
MNFRYSLLRLVILISRYFPVRLGNFLADCGGTAFFLLSPGRRKTVTENLKHILKTEDEAQKIREKSRQVFKNVGRNYFDLTRLSRITLKDLGGIVTIEGWQNLTRAQNLGKGVILATAHLGNFELGSQVLVLHGVEITVLAENFENGPMMRNVALLRQRKGVKIVPIDTKGMKDSFYILLKGGTVVIASDRDILGNGIKTRFLGEEVTLPFGAVSLAQRTGAALVPIFSIRKPANSTTLYIEPPLDLVEVENREASLKANLDKLAAVMEKYICKYPEQWAVLEPFWQDAKARAGIRHNIPRSNGMFN